MAAIRLTRAAAIFRRPAQENLLNPVQNRLRIGKNTTSTAQSRVRGQAAAGGWVASSESDGSRSSEDKQE